MKKNNKDGNKSNNKSNNKMNNEIDNNENNDKEYNLYTENIIEKPFVKYRKYIRVAELIGGGALFGFVAAIVFYSLYPAMTDSFIDNSSKKQEITIPRDEYSEEETESITKDVEDYSEEEIDEQTPSSLAIDSIFGDGYESFQQMMVQTRRSIVGITAYYKNREDDFFGDGADSQDTAGAIIALTDEEYIILTSYDVIKDANHLLVKFNDGSSVQAHLIKGDEDTGIAAVYVRASEVSNTVKSYINVAKLDNSYLVGQGDVIIAAGKLFGNNVSVNYGTVTNNNLGESAVDAYYNLLCTNIISLSGDFSFLFNTNGNIVGISKTAKQNGVINMYGVSDLKALIEQISNGDQMAYCGVSGKNVTTTLSIQYGLPMGMYVTEVAENSPAFAAGIQAGDVITMIDSETTLTFRAFSEKLHKYSPEENIIITAKRLGKDEYKEIEFNVNLTSR